MKLRKLLSAGLTSAMLFSASMLPTATAADMPFDDVKENDWFHGAVQFVFDNGIMKGVDDGVFSPNGNLTRAEFVTILCRMSGGEEKVTDTFTDVPAGEWYAGYIGWGADTGVVNGYEDHTFKPNAPMSRQEMAAAMVRYIDYRGINLPRENFAPYMFTDDESIDEWAEEFVDVLRLSGIVAGDQDVNYKPQNNISRAETATIIERLYGIIDKAWQGYIPSPEDEAIILGAKYLYWGGTVVQGLLDTDMAKDASLPYPALAASYKEDTVWADKIRALDPAGTIGVSASVAGIDLSKHHIVKICYAYDGYTDPGSLSGVYNVNNTKSSRHVEEALNFTAGAVDSGWKTATVDLKAVLDAHPETVFDKDLAHVLLKPFSDGYTGNGKFLIRYIGFFKDQAAADAFSSADQDDYLNNYFVYTNIDYRQFDSKAEAEFNTLLETRIDDILNAESAVTPKDIEAAGGKCWYVSSLNGSDSGDGKSPEKAFKTLSGLYYKKGPVTLCYATAGDGVFFERGSEFYPEIYLNYSMETFETEAGVTYGAYGKGPKPAFYAALDFRDKNDGAGIWNKTDYNNIWVLDGTVNDTPEHWGSYTEVANMVFNGGEHQGIRIKSSNEEDPFGEDRTASVFLTLGYSGDSAYVSNGDELYFAEPRQCRNIGDALTHNLEFFHDFKEGRVYLYFDKGNPGEYFDDIKCSTSATVFGGDNSNTTIDNIAILCAGAHGLRGSGLNLRMTNCEFGYIYGCEVETAMEVYGAADGIYIENCYVHDVGGALTCQNGISEKGNPIHIQNIEYANNVIVSAVTGNENWNAMGALDENGYGTNKMINQYVHDNIFAYMGYSCVKVTPPAASAQVVSSSMYGEMENCVFENNTIFYGAGYMYYAYVATDLQPRGWQTRNNTYVFNPEHEMFQYSYETINYINHNMDKNQRVVSPMNYRYLVFFTSNGVDPSGTYYFYDTATEKRIINAWLTNG